MEKPELGAKCHSTRNSESTRFSTVRLWHKVQLQMFLCDVTFCDSVVWSTTEMLSLRVALDDSFIHSAVDKATTFFKICENLMSKSNFGKKFF